MPHPLPIAIAFAVGWIIYMIAMLLTIYDGLLSLIFQPIMAAICSALAVGAALLAGLFFRIPHLRRGWSATVIPAVALVITSLALMCFGYELGLRHTYTTPDTGRQLESLRSDVFLASYFALVSAIANWPSRNRYPARPNAAPNGGPSRRIDDSGVAEGPQPVN